MLIVGVAVEEEDEKEDEDERAETGCTVAGGEDDGEVAGGVSAEDDDSFPLIALLAAGSPPFCFVVRLSPAASLGEAVRGGDAGAGDTGPGGEDAAAEAMRVGEDGRDGMVESGVQRVKHWETLRERERRSSRPPQLLSGARVSGEICAGSSR